MNVQFATTELSDQHADLSDSCTTQFKQYGGRRSFWGRIRTAKCIADNAIVRGLLETVSDGEVLVRGRGGYLGSAMVGDVLAGMGAKNGWAGIIVNGTVRDVNMLAQVDLGIKALGLNPKRSAKNGIGRVDIPVSFGSVSFTPGHWLYSDDDGIIVSAENLLDKPTSGL